MSPLFLCSSIRFDAPELIAAELENLRVLKEHELGVKLEFDPDGGGPYVPNVEK